MSTHNSKQKRKNLIDKFKPTLNRELNYTYKHVHTD